MDCQIQMSEIMSSFLFYRFIYSPVHTYIPQLSLNMLQVPLARDPNRGSVMMMQMERCALVGCHIKISETSQPTATPHLTFFASRAIGGLSVETA